MGIVNHCPYIEEKENCKFEIYDGQPRFDKCSTCDRVNIDKMEIMKNGLCLNDIQEYAHKLFKSFDDICFDSNYNYALQAFYLEDGLYVVRSKTLNKYQYTLVEADSEEQAIRNCF